MKLASILLAIPGRSGGTRTLSFASNVRGEGAPKADRTVVLRRAVAEKSNNRAVKTVQNGRMNRTRGEDWFGNYRTQQ